MTEVPYSGNYTVRSGTGGGVGVANGEGMFPGHTSVGVGVVDIKALRKVDNMKERKTYLPK